MIRKIEKKMISYIDSKLEKNGAAQLAIEEKDARLLLSYALEACVGIRESGGNNKGPMVELIQETVGSASREAWCMSFIQTGIAYVEEKLGIKSPIVPGEHCLTVWKNTPKEQRVKRVPARAAIAIWQHGKTQNGHTGLVIETDGKTFRAVEGNTESGVTSKGAVVRDGGGVYMTKRSHSGSGSMKLVGFLKPF